MYIYWYSTLGSCKEPIQIGLQYDLGESRYILSLDNIKRLALVSIININIVLSANMTDDLEIVSKGKRWKVWKT